MKTQQFLNSFFLNSIISSFNINISSSNYRVLNDTVISE